MQKTVKHRTVQQTERTIRIVCTIVLSVVALFWMIPVIWVLLNSFKTNAEFTDPRWRV